MALQSALLLLGLVWSASAVAAKQAVIEVDEDSFDEQVDNNEYVMMFFCKRQRPALYIYLHEQSLFACEAASLTGACMAIDAPWCGHCTQLKPIYEEAAEILQSDGVSNVQFTKIDATLHKTLASEFGLKGYPTLKWFHNGEPDDYTGQRATDAMVKWVKKRTNAKVRALKGQSELDDMKVRGGSTR
jgi:protein disulfide-isomerase-like protein